MKLELKDLTTIEKQYYLQHLVAPRPICFASTIDREGNVNLSPFSFFNMFSSNPPVVIFSPSRRVRDNTTKHTLQNLAEVPEVVINMVSYDMVQQASLASCEYPKGVDEFVKAGFTKEQAAIVTPPMVRESKAKLECQVLTIQPLGIEAGAGNLVICEVIYLHIDDSLLSADNTFNQEELQLVARLGGDWYCRVSKENLFLVPKPNALLGIGFDALPDKIRNSKVLSGNDLGKLANVQQIPAFDPSIKNEYIERLFAASSQNDIELLKHRYAAQLLEENKIEEAWQVLLYLDSQTGV